MDLSGSYFHRLMDLAQPLGNSTTEVIPLAQPLDAFEENLEVETDFIGETQQTPQTLASSLEKRNSSDDARKKKQNFGEDFLQLEVVEKTVEDAKIKAMFPPTVQRGETSKNETALRSAAEIPNSFLQKEGLESETESDSPRKPPSSSAVLNENFAAPKNPSSSSTMEEFFEKVFGPQEKGPSRAEMAELTESMEFFEQASEASSQKPNQVMVFTTEQKQTLRQYIQVAIENFENKNPEKTEKNSFLRAPRAPAGPLWRGWTGRSNFPGRMK